MLKIKKVLMERLLSVKGGFFINIMYGADSDSPKRHTLDELFSFMCDDGIISRHQYVTWQAIVRLLEAMYHGPDTFKVYETWADIGSIGTDDLFRMAFPSLDPNRYIHNGPLTNNGNKPKDGEYGFKAKSNKHLWFLVKEHLDIQAMHERMCNYLLTGIVANAEIKHLSLNVVDSLITAAFEGGSNYWYLINPDSLVKPSGFKRDEGVHYALLDAVYQGGSVIVHDVNDVGEILGYLNVANINRGISLMSERYMSSHWKDIITGEWDAETADVFLQLCVMGDIVFG